MNLATRKHVSSKKKNFIFSVQEVVLQVCLHFGNKQESPKNQPISNKLQ